MKLIDTHTHLYSDQFDGDRKEVIRRAQAAGVEQFFLPAIDSSHIPAMKSLAQQYPSSVHLMAGLHPTSVNAQYEREIEIVKSELSSLQYVAVGEIGVDLFWNTTYREAQMHCFREQVKLAIQHSLPIVIHCRNAFDEVFEVLEEFDDSPLRGIFHCFTGTLEQAEKAIGIGLHLGIGGVVTFKNGKIDQFLSQLPLEKIVLETDAPFLAPTPHRGKRNESAHLLLIATRVAQLYAMPIAEVARQTTATARDIFKV